MIRVGTLPEGSRGFDANTRVTPQVASLFWDHGYRFVVRYVRRSTKHDYDLSVSELVGLLKAGLSVMVVQHVAAEGWHPMGSLGSSYGAIAAEEARAVGIPPGVTVWCDLEGISALTDSRDVIAFCNSWFDAVKAAGFDPGLYVGYGCGLTADQLYYKLKFRRYWSAYNLNVDAVPSVRGVCMEQLAYPPQTASDRTVQKYMEKYHLSHFDAVSLATRVPGVPFEYDADIVTRDHFNNLPSALLPGDPG